MVRKHRPLIGVAVAFVLAAGWAGAAAQESAVAEEPEAKSEDWVTQWFKVRRRDPDEAAESVRELLGSDRCRVRTDVADGWISVEASRRSLDHLRLLTLVCADPDREPLHILPLQHAQPSKVTKVLNATLELWQLDTAVYVTADDRTGKLIVRAEKHELDDIAQLVKLLDRPAGPRRATVGPESRPAEPAPKVAAKRPAGDEFKPQASLKGQRVAILEGKIPIAQFLRFYADFTGQTVIRAKSQTPIGGRGAAQEHIDIVAPVHAASAAVVKAIHEANGWRLRTKTLRDGEAIVVVHRVGESVGFGIERPKIIDLRR